MKIILALAVLIQLNVSTVFAFEDEGYGYFHFDETEATPTPTQDPIPSSRSKKQTPKSFWQDDGARIQKFERLLRSLGHTPEPTPDLSSLPKSETVAQTEVMNQMRFIDPDGGLKRYLDFNLDGVRLFRDFFSSILPATFLEYQKTWSRAAQSFDSQTLLDRLNETSFRVRNQSTFPLRGLKILLDPGHMGDLEWDDHTGKFVEFQGQRISEGKIATWTAYLIAQQLESLGAEVRLTRLDLGPVSSVAYERFQAQNQIERALHQSLDDWMKKYIHLNGSELKASVQKSAEYKNLFTERARRNFYILGEDLDARAQIMKEFQPDLTLVIHFDASNARPRTLQRKMNDVEAYVPGAFRMNETGSRENRVLALQHLLETRRWAQSVQAAQNIVGALSQELELPLLNLPTFLSAVKVSDGVYARNLNLTRKSKHGLMVYLECLHYDHANEFPQLIQTNASSTYQGRFFQYPARLEKIAHGVKKGLLQYFQRFSTQTLL